MTTKSLTPHEHKLFTELFTRVRLSIEAVVCLHTELEHDFAARYDLTGDETFKQAFDNIHSVQPPILPGSIGQTQ
jgi:hypothetical protein